jgi:diguanylate cyclase (GGDEF)-like protein/PAS domain S-box-containing protein
MAAFKHLQAVTTISHEDRYETLVELSPDALYVVQDNFLVFINNAGTRQMRARCPEELLGLPLSAIVHPQSMERVAHRLRKMFETGMPAPIIEQKYLRLDGTTIDVEVCAAPFLYEGRPAIQVIARDITDRKVAQEALRISEQNLHARAQEAMSAHRTLQLEKRILEKMAFDMPLPLVLSEICIEVEQHLSGNAACTILLIKPDNLHITVAAAPSLPKRFSTLIEGSIIGPEAGICGRCIYLGQQLVVEDIDLDPRWDAYREAARKIDLRACWSTPIVDAIGKVVGAFGVYYHQPQSPSPEDFSFIDDITHLVGIALQKEKIERSLQESEERYRSVVNSLHEGIIVQSKDGIVLACNPSAERILHVQPGSLIGLRHGSFFTRIMTEDGIELCIDALPSQEVFTNGQPQLGLILAIEISNGKKVWISENVVPIYKPGAADPESILISFSDITEVKDAQQCLQYMATHDSLTGLPNRAFLAERLASALLEAEMHGYHIKPDFYQRIAVLFLDLDRFKSVNDSVGHEAGDDLLRMVAGRLNAVIGATDTLARLGGDEFVILVHRFEDKDYPAQLCERVLATLAEPFVLEGNEYYLGVSIGVANYPQDGQTGTELLRCADTAMYFAKESGRNNFQFFTPQLHDKMHRRYYLEHNLRRAMGNNELFIHYQPKVDAINGRIVGAEALLRWESAQIGDVTPTEFIPLAEETGLIVAIGAWTLEQACKQAVLWRKSINADFCMAVNLSPRQFLDDGVVAMVKRALTASGLPASGLELEITEGLLMGDNEKLMPVFDALTGIGVKFSIDDFGTGYSSLAYLQRFPIQHLKIDRSFISRIPESRDSIVLTQAIIAMSRALGMKVTAEGVEDSHQMEFLKQAGCNEMQGFFFGRPVAIDTFELLHQ